MQSTGVIKLVFYDIKAKNGIEKYPLRYRERKRDKSQVVFPLSRINNRPYYDRGCISTWNMRNKKQRKSRNCHAFLIEDLASGLLSDHFLIAIQCFSLDFLDKIFIHEKCQNKNAFRPHRHIVDL